MYGDFARVTFDALKSYNRVLQQQGRVQLEADWNEQGAIFLHLLRTLVTDLVGPAAGPESNCGFSVVTREWLQKLPASDKRREWIKLLTEAGDFVISKGHYYVDGLLCDNPRIVSYLKQTAQIGGPPEKMEVTTDDSLYLAYLDVVEHSVFAAEDPSLLEVAIGIETAIRARQSWVVRTVPLKSGKALADMEPSWDDLVDRWQSASRGWLKCRAGGGSEGPSSDPCNVAPQSRYRGPENQLYRIEVHQGGTIEPAKRSKNRGKGNEPAEYDDRPTFKFSRVNGSAVFQIETLAGDVATLADLGKDDRFNLDEGDWVEILDDTTILPETPGPLRKIVAVDTFTRQVTLAPATGAPAGVYPDRHPIMRRWDQRHGEAKGRGLRLRDGVAPIELDEWIPLEDGIEIFFQAPDDATGAVVFRSGDYWLAPARVATGGIIDWPPGDDGPKAIPPHGVAHHYAPLAILKVENKELTVFSQCRRVFEIPTKILQKVL
jgi:hypothetical protein